VGIIPLYEDRRKKLIIQVLLADRSLADVGRSAQRQKLTGGSFEIRYDLFRRDNIMTFWDFLDQHIATILVTLLGIAGFLVNYLRDIKSSERILDKVNLEWKKEYQEKYLIIPIMEYYTVN
jgi:hypothetical protein